MAFVALTDLNGNAVYVEPQNVVALTPIPANLLPPGVMAGSYVGDCDASARLTVQGSPAVVAAALSAGGGTGGAILARGSVDGATGSVTMLGGAPFTGVQNATGAYTLSRTTGSWPAGTQLLFTPISASFISQDSPVGATDVDVATADDQGVAADVDFVVVFVGAP